MLSDRDWTWSHGIESYDCLHYDVCSEMEGTWIQEKSEVDRWTAAKLLWVSTAYYELHDHGLRKLQLAGSPSSHFCQAVTPHMSLLRMSSRYGVLEKLRWTPVWIWVWFRIRGRRDSADITTSSDLRGSKLRKCLLSTVGILFIANPCLQRSRTRECGLLYLERFRKQTVWPARQPA